MVARRTAANGSPAAKLAVVRGAVCKRQPYFTSLADSLTLVESDAFPTLAVTNTMILFYSPEFVKRIDLKTLAFGYYHELLHVFHDHPARALKAGLNRPSDIPINVKKWAWMQAEESFVNQTCKEVWGWAPDWVVTFESFEAKFGQYLTPNRGGTTEEFYVAILRLFEKAKAEDPDLADEIEDEADAHASGTSHADGCNGHCHAPGDVGDNHPAARARDEVLELVKEAGEALSGHVQRYPGSVPGHLLRQATLLKQKPEVPWETQFRNVTRRCLRRKAGAVDYTFSGGVSRRQAAVGYGIGRPVMPRLYAPDIQVEFWCDTSGSMSAEALGMACRECMGIMKSLGVPLRFYAVDKRVQREVIVRSEKDLLQALGGGGGTSFIPPFEAVMERPKRARPDLIVYATDGFGRAPSHNFTKIPTIWLLTPTYNSPPSVPNFGDGEPWGTMIVLKKTQ